MQNFRDYYQILDISKTATTDQIKQAYRRLARRYHPDLNPGDKAAEEHFKVLSEAYEVLSDPAKRSQYEEYSRFWNKTNFADRRSRDGYPGAQDADFSEWDDFNHFVDQLLNRHQGHHEVITTSTVQSEDPFQPSKRKTTYTIKSRATRRDAQADLTIPLERAYVGGRERIRLEDGRSLEVNMPAGMVSGQRIRLRGQGIGGGDLYLNITVEPHPYFTLQDADVVCRLPITPAEAILGGVITVPTLDGPVQMTIPAGVQPAQKLRLAGKGYPTTTDRGDQIMIVEVTIPTVLNPEEKVLYQQLQSIETFDPRAALLGGWG